MTTNELPHRWAEQCGLALAPLFEMEEAIAAGSHHVLLDGGFGSFALSVSPDELWREANAANWAWSSDLPHHVTVTDKAVAVTRWDRRRPEILSRSSVEAQIESFYEYLTADRVRSSQRVVDHVLGLFRRIRSLVADAGISDEFSIDAFLAFLTRLIENDRPPPGGALDRAMVPQVDAGAEVLEALPSDGVKALMSEVLADKGSLHSYRLFPSLAVRHAGSEIFQEAHFELLRAPEPDLFGVAGSAQIKAVTRGGAHFTPPALARTVVEQTLRQVEGLARYERLVILDPACGSGAFLHETVRALRRLDFKGKAILVGRDISRAAISMAQFVVRHAAADWSPPGGVEINIKIGDSLEIALPRADVVVMNPPFIAWSALDSRQRDQMREVLGSRLQGRGDLSMAFISRALDLAKQGGAIGVLFPASLLTLQAAEGWRNDLLERSDLCLLASLGDYGLFAHALIQVAAAVLAKPPDQGARRRTTTALVTSNDAAATGNALRTLRRSGRGERGFGEDDAWRLFELPIASIKRRTTWRLTSPKTEAALSRLIASGASRISDLFEVRQGVRTGDNRTFLLDEREFASLPAKERAFFKPAVMNESIQDGRLRLLYWVFYPYDNNGQIIQSETDLLESIPVYARRYLLPKRETLMQRASVTRAQRQDWWRLSRERSSWALGSGPRIVSKYFGGPGGFSTDIDGVFIVVQGFAWFPKWGEGPSGEDGDLVGFPRGQLLCAYAALMNSQRFGRILELFSPHVAGGQFDLSPRYVDAIPMPDLATLARDEHAGRLITRLAEFGREPRLADADWRVSTDRITSELYGGDFFDQV